MHAHSCGSGGGTLGAPERLARALQAGAHVAFQEPIGGAALLAAVRELLGHEGMGATGSASLRTRGRARGSRMAVERLLV